MQRRPDLCDSNVAGADRVGGVGSVGGYVVARRDLRGSGRGLVWMVSDPRVHDIEGCPGCASLYPRGGI